MLYPQYCIRKTNFSILFATFSHGSSLLQFRITLGISWVNTVLFVFHGTADLAFITAFDATSFASKTRTLLPQCLFVSLRLQLASPEFPPKPSYLESAIYCLDDSMAEIQWIVHL